MTTENQTTPGDDEIDLKELFKSLWNGRKMVAACVLLAIGLASSYLWLAERKFSVRYTLQPVANDDSTPTFGGLGGLASLAGVSLPTGGSSDFKTFQALLQSEETASALMENADLIRRIYTTEWSDEDQQFVAPERSMLGLLGGALKLVLTGESRSAYVPPNAARLSVYLNEAFSKSEDRDTGFLRLSTETPDPSLLVDVITAATLTTDKLIRDRFVERGQETVEFYQRKIGSARSREHREALAQLIVQEEQKLMLASIGGNFVVKPLTAPSISLEPTSPKPALILALAIMLGIFAGAAIVLVREAFQNA